jgi:putative hydrolase of the HAD superfamily
MVISAEVGVMKPDPQIYQLALEKLNVTPAESVFIDDFTQNVEGARAVGMNVIQFAAHDQAMDELEKMLALSL